MIYLSSLLSPAVGLIVSTAFPLSTLLFFFLLHTFSAASDTKQIVDVDTVEVVDDT
jgi:hypothetical protein